MINDALTKLIRVTRFSGNWLYMICIIWGSVWKKATARTNKQNSAVDGARTQVAGNKAVKALCTGVFYLSHGGWNKTE